jgi:malonyl-CoA decarboxylase
MADGLVKRLRSLVKVGAGATATIKPKQLDEWRRQLAECAEAKGGEVSARTRAAALAQTYLNWTTAAAMPSCA